MVECKACEKKGVFLAALLSLAFSASLSGCVSYGVATELRPYSHITRTNERQFQKEVRGILDTLPLNTCVPISKGQCGLYRTTDGYFLIRESAEGLVNTERAIYLGRHPRQAESSMITLYRQINHQRATALAALAEALAYTARQAERSLASDPTSPVGHPVSTYTPRPTSSAFSPSTQRKSYATSHKPTSDSHSPTSHNPMTVFDSGGQVLGYALPSGDASGMMHVFDRNGQVLGYGLPSGDASGMMHVFDTKGRPMGYGHGD